MVHQFIDLFFFLIQSKKKKPNEEIQKIRSESQRMVRESSVCLPYHKVYQNLFLILIEQ